ncbi:hypothetical protein [Nevskia sp.]|uniref:hypothetical protein n=1 Tax=Nevskia sp. TaxID=1929292 RepID=UPI003F6F4130
MTVAIWPAALPVLLRDGYSYELAELTERTDFDFGSRARLLYLDGPDTFTASALFNAAGCERFKAWFRYEAASGANPVSMPLLVGSVLGNREVFITAPPSIALEGVNHWRVRLALETRTGTTMSRAEYDAL